jgi:hypothetical protein
LVEESDPAHRSPWWWRKGHLALDGDPPLRDAVEGHATSCSALASAWTCERETERERERIRTDRVRMWG